jgi:hypothetical protein
MPAACTCKLGLAPQGEQGASPGLPGPNLARQPNPNALGAPEACLRAQGRTERLAGGAVEELGCCGLDSREGNALPQPRRFRLRWPVWCGTKL